MNFITFIQTVIISKTLANIIKYFKHPKNFENLIRDINFIEKNEFENIIEYKQYVKDILFDILNDHHATYKDNKLKTENMKIKNFNEYSLNENFYIPNVKLSHFLNGVKPITESNIKAVETYYKTYRQYIDIVDKDKHLLKVNDVTGDIMNNNRVIMQVYTFNESEIEVIRTNIVNYCITTFYSELPQEITVFGAVISPMYVINREDLKKIIESKITNDLTVKIISVITGFSYAGVQDKFYIWRNGTK
jgi:hypothetical protein